MNRGLIYTLLVLVLLVGYYLFRTYRAERNIERQLTELAESPETPFQLAHDGVDVSPLWGYIGISDLEIGSKSRPQHSFRSGNITFEIGYGSFIQMYLFGVESELRDIRSGTVVFDNLSYGDAAQPWAEVRELTLTQSGALAGNIQELIENQWVRRKHNLKITLDRLTIDPSRAPSYLSKWLLLSPVKEGANFRWDRARVELNMLPDQSQLAVEQASGHSKDMEFKIEGSLSFDKDTPQLSAPSSFTASLELAATGEEFYRFTYGPESEYDYLDLKGIQAEGSIYKDFSTDSKGTLPPGVISLTADSARWPIPEPIVTTYRSFLTLAGWQGAPLSFSELEVRYSRSEESDSIELDPASVTTPLGNIALNGTLIPAGKGDSYRWINTQLTIKNIEPGLMNMLDIAERMFQMRMPVRDGTLVLELSGPPYSPSVSFN